MLAYNNDFRVGRHTSTDTIFQGEKLVHKMMHTYTYRHTQKSTQLDE